MELITQAALAAIETRIMAFVAIWTHKRESVVR